MRERAIAALLSEPTLQAAADASGVSLRTLKRWRKEESFRHEFEAAKSEMLERATAKLRRRASVAVDVLSSIAADGKAPAASRVTAARAMLELALRSHETETLEERIKSLERIVEYENRETEKPRGSARGTEPRETETLQSERTQTG